MSGNLLEAGKIFELAQENFFVEKDATTYSSVQTPPLSLSSSFTSEGRPKTLFFEAQAIVQIWHTKIGVVVQAFDHCILWEEGHEELIRFMEETLNRKGISCKDLNNANYRKATLNNFRKALDYGTCFVTASNDLERESVVAAVQQWVEKRGISIGYSKNRPLINYPCPVITLFAALQGTEDTQRPVSSPILPDPEFCPLK